MSSSAEDLKGGGGGGGGASASASGGGREGSGFPSKLVLILKKNKLVNNGGESESFEKQVNKYSIRAQILN